MKKQENASVRQRISIRAERQKYKTREAGGPEETRKDTFKLFVERHESCLVSMKMNGQDFSKKQAKTKIHPSCQLA